MPRYIIFRIKGTGSNQKTVTVGTTGNLRSVRAAWSWYKKHYKRILRKDWEYHIFPINHARSWKFNGEKWVIGSWYGNHNAKEYAKKMQKIMTAVFKKREKINQQ
jgi:hypothetical protein